MSQPDQLPVDLGNQLLGETPAQLATALLDTPAGQRLALTIRTASTTLTVLLGAGGRQDVGRRRQARRGRHEHQRADRRRMSIGSIGIAAGVPLPHERAKQRDRGA